MIVGVSPDPVSANSDFAKAEGFPYPLLSDEDKTVSRQYGCIFPEGHEYAGYTKRISYLITPEGDVFKTYKVRDILGHPDQVLHDLREATAKA